MDSPLASARRIEVVGAGQDATRVRAGGPVLLRGTAVLRASRVDGVHASARDGHGVTRLSTIPLTVKWPKPPTRPRKRPR